MPDSIAENNFTQLVGCFLAEAINSRRTSLRRASEIFQLAAENLSILVSESEALALIRIIEKEFQELAGLKKELRFDYCNADLPVYEREIKDYAVTLLRDGITRSAAFLKDAAEDADSIHQLCRNHPGFCNYLLCQTPKGELLPELQQAY